MAHRRDVPWVIAYFLEHGYYGYGGAIAIARAHPDWSPGQVAQAVQGSGRPWAYEPRHAQAIALNRQFCHGEGL
jgi:hypothetical protein